MKRLLALSILLIMLSPTIIFAETKKNTLKQNKLKESYICVEEAGVGFEHKNGDKDWTTTKFSPSTFIFKQMDSGHIESYNKDFKLLLSYQTYGVYLLGRHKPLAYCEHYEYGEGTAECESVMLRSFNINLNSLRFTHTSIGALYFELSTAFAKDKTEITFGSPMISYGKCSKI